MMVATAVASGIATANAEKAKAFKDKRKTFTPKHFDKECGQLIKEGFCDFETRRGTECRFKHGTRTSNIQGTIRKIEKK